MPFWIIFGVPINFLAMNKLTELLVRSTDQEMQIQMINEEPQQDEIDQLIKLGVADDDGILSYAEYVILCAIRLGALDPGLIEEINKRFKLLDKDGNGYLSYAEMLEDPTAVERQEDKHSV